MLSGFPLLWNLLNVQVTVTVSVTKVVFFSQEAIANASTLEEVRKLELLLQQGHVPGKTDEQKDGSEEVEMEA